MAYRNMETARIAKGYTRPELADIIGVKPELGSLIRMADALEVSLDYLVGRSSA